MYWNEDGVRECKDTVCELKNLRDEYRESGNECQDIVKLIMNTSYGRLVLRKTDESHVVKGSEDTMEYVSERFGLFKQMTRFGNHTEISLAKYDDSYSRNHLGCLILSMSKRYLHEVLDLCEFLNVNVYYVNTDSMHLDKEKVSMLAAAYLHKYNNVLICKELGQFHCDFKISCGHTATAYSRYCLIVGPKVYYDDVVCDICNVNNEHYRCKGIPANCVQALCQQYDCHVQDIFERLCSSPVTFNLNPPGTCRMCIKVTGVYNVPENTFTCTLCFI